MGLDDGANQGKVFSDILSSSAESVQDASEGEQTHVSAPRHSLGNRHQHDLGMINPAAAEISVTVAGKDYTLKQSPGLLTSARSGGTTGAAVWRTTSLLAEWFAAPDNILFRSGLLSENSTSLELGAGVAGLLPLVLGSRIRSYHATDQPYALKLLQENIDANKPLHKPKQRRSVKPSNVSLASLDWENDDLDHFLDASGLPHGVDMVIASDCVYNYHLIQPLTNTCNGICQRRESGRRPTICLVAQQLREPDVFEEWLTVFMQSFHTWRLTESALRCGQGLQPGYAIHVGILRNAPAV